MQLWTVISHSNLHYLTNIIVTVFERQYHYSQPAVLRMLPTFSNHCFSVRRYNRNCGIIYGSVIMATKKPMMYQTTTTTLQPSYGSACISTLSWDWRILLEQSITACKPLLTAARAFGLGRSYCSQPCCLCHHCTFPSPSVYMRYTS